MYDEAGHWLGDYSAPNAPIQQAIWLDDLPIGLLTGTGASQSVQTLQPDHLGSPRVAIDTASNQAIWRWDLKGEAFGATPPSQDPDGDGQAFVLNMRFPGQRFDAATGLNYNYFRDYEPGTGRYVQSDPIGLRGGISTYAYVAGNPVMYVDPYGLEVVFVPPIPYLPPWFGTLVRGVSVPTIVLNGVWPHNMGYASCEMMGPGACARPNTQESRGNNDPVVLPPVNPGRDCDGNCNPCPPGVRWFINKPGHGHENGYWHIIRYNQDPKTCMCYPDRPSRGLEGF